MSDFYWSLFLKCYNQNLEYFFFKVYLWDWFYFMKILKIELNTQTEYILVQ